MRKFTATLTCETTDGPDSITSNPVGWDELVASTCGMVAAVGEDNVIKIVIEPHGT